MEEEIVNNRERDLADELLAACVLFCLWPPVSLQRLLSRFLHAGVSVSLASWMSVILMDSSSLSRSSKLKRRWRTVFSPSSSHYEEEEMREGLLLACGLKPPWVPFSSIKEEKEPQAPRKLVTIILQTFQQLFLSFILLFSK